MHQTVDDLKAIDYLRAQFSFCDPKVIAQCINLTAAHRERNTGKRLPKAEAVADGILISDEASIKTFIETTLLDHADPEEEPSKDDPPRSHIDVRIEFDSDWIQVMPKGYGEPEAPKGHGCPVMMEFYDNTLRLVVYPNILDSSHLDDTMVINLEGARESLVTDWDD